MIEFEDNSEIEPEFSEMDIVMAQQLNWMLRLHKSLDAKVYKSGSFTFNMDGYPITINRHFVDVLKRMTFTARYQYFVDSGHPELARDIYLTTMESTR